MASFAEPNPILSVKHVQQPGNTHRGELPPGRRTTVQAELR